MKHKCGQNRQSLMTQENMPIWTQGSLNQECTAGDEARSKKLQIEFIR